MKFLGYKRVQEAGFTLIEVLAALLIFSFAIIGLTQAGTQSARAVGALDLKMLAGIVADNQLVLARMQEPETGIARGSSVQMSRDFSYIIETRPTQINQLFQVTVSVNLKNDEQVLERRIGFHTVSPEPAEAGPSQDSDAPNNVLDRGQ